MGFFPTGNKSKKDKYRDDRIVENKLLSDEDLALNSKDRKMSESISSLNENIKMRVVIRIRPLNSTESQFKPNNCRTIQTNDDSKTLQIYGTDNKISAFSFNRVFDEQSDQKTFFETSGVSLLIPQALLGYTATIFAFGQTGRYNFY